MMGGILVPERWRKREEQIAPSPEILRWKSINNNETEI